MTLDPCPPFIDSMSASWPTAGAPYRVMIDTTSIPVLARRYQFTMTSWTTTGGTNPAVILLFYNAADAVIQTNAYTLGGHSQPYVLADQLLPPEGAVRIDFGFERFLLTPPASVSLDYTMNWVCAPPPPVAVPARLATIVG